MLCMVSSLTIFSMKSDRWENDQNCENLVQFGSFKIENKFDVFDLNPKNRLRIF